ncbi:cytochrome c biogenesis protein ResB [Streptomyces sp. HNM0574]|uniref:cytochrome c biogenesis protein ResB n=1 Tax=Streptomyces sp. HNM0574 TaxID=2714954 RepID=UPI00146C9FB2|nr:cytochrome c biogenesis protein ResB [Streptomyces sp. HNM0574]NLU70262.1 cytochrome c biogenesis protein ResB [Streptomyces sp. HNM0574]
MSTTETGSDTGARSPGADEAAEATERAETAEASSALSTAPGEEKLNVPALGVIGWARWFWRQLTSMRVALILLFLLSLGAIPGSVIPQTSVDSVKVEQFKEKHELLTPVYEKLQLFDVYTSVWFSAIYILLFISLVGCIVPRTWQFVGQLRSRPPRAPRRLDRMPAYTTWHTDADPEQVLGAARTMLKRKRFRVNAEGNAVTSEKGYLREAGNLLFHIALIVLLLAFAAGQLWKAEGNKLIIQGDGFANTLTQYDDFRSGSLFTADDLDNFGFTLKDFHARFEKTGPQKGSARDYRADISYWEGDGKEKDTTVKVNEPLRSGDAKVYLMAHGFAPVVTVKDGKGDVAFRGPVAFLQQDTNLTASGVVKVTDYRDAKGRKDQLGFQGFFVPTYAPGSGSMFSQWPELKNPVMFLTAYHGDLGLDYGAAQNVYQLDTENLKQFKKKDGSPLAQKLVPGDTMKLPDGAGSLKFEGVKEWANFQISHEVGNGWALGGAMTAIAGLAGSLFIQRRRVWVRAVRGADGRTVVEMAGLARSESAKLPEELGDLAYTLQSSAPTAPAPAPEPEAGTEAESAPEEPETASASQDGDENGDQDGDGTASQPETGESRGDTADTRSSRGERQ